MTDKLSKAIVVTKLLGAICNTTIGRVVVAQVTVHVYRSSDVAVVILSLYILLE